MGPKVDKGLQYRHGSNVPLRYSDGAVGFSTWGGGGWGAGVLIEPPKTVGGGGGGAQEDGSIDRTRSQLLCTWQMMIFFAPPQRADSKNPIFIFRPILGLGHWRVTGGQ